MNNLRKAAQAGATIRRVKSRDPKTGRVMAELRNPARRAKRELSLSGRQLKRLRKQLAREERAQRSAS